jgi:formylglycine-generating enzyme required for sulfatase activity/uncharacterized caspase-like protein
MVEKSPLENAFALIIGVSNYKDPNIRKLNYTRADAEGINKILSDPKKVGLNPEKIKILLDENATLFNIKNAITDWLYKNANKDSYVLIYFAGHGGLEEDKLGTEADNWAKYLLPFDTVKDNLYASALSNREFHDLLRSIKSRKLVIFMDSCYSGGVSGGKARDVDVKITDDPYKKLAEGEGRLVIAASQPNQQSFENDGLGHGVFTYHLIEALSGAADFDKDGVVTAMEVYQYLTENVPKTVKRLEGREQVPLVRAELKTDFVVAVNNERIYEVDCEKIKKEKLDRLWDLYNKKELSPEQYELACKVVESICEDLSEDELKVLKLVNDLLDNKIKNISRFRSDLDRFIGKERQTGIIKSEAVKATEGKIKKQEEIDIEKKNKNRLQGKTETLQKEEGEIKKKEREERKQITREGEKKTSEDGKKPSNNRLFAVLLMLFLLVLGYWGLAPGGNESIVSQASDQKAITNSIGMDLVLIPSGEFDMGSPTNEKDRFSYENPVHHVNISNAFYLGKYEVTQKQWRDVMGRSPSGFKGDNRPVEQVSWYDVQDFIKKLNEKEGVNKYRLPSEAEWEYADRAGTTTRYFFGDDESKLSEFAWYDSNSETVTHDVGQKKPNPWGLYDMNGNVMEWVQDKWHTDYYGAPTDGSSWESGDSSDRIYRGGDWINNARICRSAERIWSDPGNRGGSLGFRLLRVL